ncbi:hypothetical protein HMPREF0758_4274 [Serratia odorifera DSM 4582]|uniref:Uncharacterized protein n=1 Tax=Serratia odorifera DSM 4582 TaxID=667129 RepID=D4E7X4_SEROD|nr:hypothetical protein HMPREF0758_4274 [Serratia odorifera DSM 4582]
MRDVLSRMISMICFAGQLPPCGMSFACRGVANAPNGLSHPAVAADA